MSLLSIFRKKKTRQDVCLITETNRVMDVHLDAGTKHAESEETAEAWGLDSRQQCKDEKTRRYVQFACSLSCDPIAIYRATERVLLKSDASLIASQTEDQEMTFIDYGSRKDGRLLWVGITLAALTLTICLAILMRVKG